MFARIEVAVRPEFVDPQSQGILRRIELAHPSIRKQIRWARMIDLYWLDLPSSREEVITAVGEVFQDRVMNWLFTGNMIPSAAGKHGGLLDLMEASPVRPGNFWAIERRFRPGVTDNVGRTTLEAFEIVMNRKIPEGRAASGNMFLMEGAELNEDTLAVIARDILCNELMETWTILAESEIKGSDRFHQERIKRDFPKFLVRGVDQVQPVPLEGLGASELEALSKKKLWALTAEEMQAIQSYYSRPEVQAQRRELGLGAPTDVELEVLAQTWSEHCKHKIFGATVTYEDQAGNLEEIPAETRSLFKTTIAGTTAELPKPWLLSVFEDNAGIVAFDEDDAFCIKVETHNSPSALDPYGGALTGIVGVNRDILGCGLGAKPIFNTNVFCVARPDYSQPLPDRLLHPRRILDGVRRGVEHGGNKSGIPTVNGALCFDDRFLGKPLIYCGTGGFMPRVSAGRRCETKEIRPGDQICMVGGRIGKDGIHGATFSSLALDEFSPMSAVQLGDPITQKRAADFLLEARELGFYRAITDNGAGGLSSSVGELARLSGGARLDVSRAKTKYPGLKPFELVVSESQERMTVAVDPSRLKDFLLLAERRGVEVSELGTFTDTGRFDIFFKDKLVASLDLEFLHKGVPELKLQAVWKGRPSLESPGDAASSLSIFVSKGEETLLALLSRPNIASKEWLIRQYDHEVQGMSVVKPLHTAHVGTAPSSSGPNDAAVVKPKPQSDAGIAVGCGLVPRLSDFDPYLMAQAAVDESVRNVLCVGAEYGRTESVMALVDNFCWPDPVKDPAKAAALVRACYGLRSAALGLGLPLVSGKDSMKNDYRGKLGERDVVISVPPTLLMTAVAKVADIKLARTADFKSTGDVIYLLGEGELGLLGSELYSLWEERRAMPSGVRLRLPAPNWPLAGRLYSWIGGAIGSEQSKLKSLHDVSEGGLLTAIAEGVLARGLGATLDLSGWTGAQGNADLMELAFGEGFHSFVASVAGGEAHFVESDWQKAGVPYRKIGQVTGTDQLEVKSGERVWKTTVKKLRAAWNREGYWE